MRVPSYTQYKHQIESMTNQYDNIANVRARMASGKKLLNSSDDPILAQSINSTKDYIELLNSYSNNLTMAQTRTALASSSISGCINEMSRISELIKSAQSDTLNDADRQNIAIEIQGLLKNVANLANTRDGSGNYIFSGTSASTIPFSVIGSHYQYMGSYEASTVNVSQLDSLIYGESGQKVFGDILTGNGSFTISSGATANTGTAETTIGFISGNTAYVKDTYTMSFVTNSSGQLSYQIVGATSGQVIPVPPLTSPNDAPPFVDGQTVSFNGVNFVMTGKPALTDSFVVTPSTKQNALETINQVVTLLNKPIVTAADKAAFHQGLSELSESIKGINKHFIQYQSEVGFRSKEVESAIAMNTKDISDQKIILGDYEDADQLQLISDLTAKMTSLEMTQKTYVKLQEFFSQLLQASF